MCHQVAAGKALRNTKLVLNNNYHLVHHDLPHVPWFALRDVYETSRQQYIERSGGFLVAGYSEWLRRYALAPVAHPVHGNLPDFIQRNSPRQRDAAQPDRQASPARS
jgi:fatty acid desaturase